MLFRNYKEINFVVVMIGAFSILQQSLDDITSTDFRFNVMPLAWHDVTFLQMLCF